MIRPLLLSPALALLFIACKKHVDGNVEPFGFKAPSDFPVPVYNFENNPQSYRKFMLGKALFFDPVLSSDSTISCSSCHEQAHGFGAHATALSAGVGGALGTRNSPGIMNLAWSPSFMWDGGVNHIEVMPVSPITNPLEMNETLANVVAKLQNSERYRELFKSAYGSQQVTSERMLKAMAQYLAMLVSDQSKYDKMRRGEAAFTSQEQAGYELFVQKCSQCHTEPLFTDHSFRNNGLDDESLDAGRAAITQLQSDHGKFRVPTLRNVELTNPYMHDGRFFTLNQVLEHYNSGIHQSATLDPALASGIPLSGAEKQSLVAFLKTLTDYKFISDPLLMGN
jgi:cytochrome c peroxidase